MPISVYADCLNKANRVYLREMESALRLQERQTRQKGINRRQSVGAGPSDHRPFDK